MEGELTEKKDTRKQIHPSPSARAEKKSDSFTRKIKPLQGGLVREMIRCGRANCKCANGSLHGPYYYRVWMVRGTRFKRYVRKCELSAVQAGINEHRRQMSEVRHINQQSRETWLMLKAQLQRLDQLLRSVGYDV